eukprot:1121459-Pyramimonas_sp.AAC.1
MTRGATRSEMVWVAPVHGYPAPGWCSNSPSVKLATDLRQCSGAVGWAAPPCRPGAGCRVSA